MKRRAIVVFIFVIKEYNKETRLALFYSRIEGLV